MLYYMAMELQEFKDTIAYNLVWFRKKKSLTQLQLAEKLNYSDKAISKWERGESLPDAYTLQQLAEFYEVTLDDFLVKHRRAPLFDTGKKKIIITIMSCLLVWIVATGIYMITGLAFKDLKDVWLVFLWAIPATAIVLVVFSAVWGKTWMLVLSASLILWGIGIGLYVTLNRFVPENLWWLIFIAAIPVQLLFILWFILKLIKRPKEL